MVAAASSKTAGCSTSSFELMMKIRSYKFVNVLLCMNLHEAFIVILADARHFKLAWNDGFQDIEVELDNQEVVDTLNANPHIHETSLIRRIRKLLQNRWKVKLSYVRQEGNAAAKAIAHLEGNAGLGFTTLHECLLQCGIFLIWTKQAE
ncbi:hypothetical protein F3Y22_tig00112255pilonHSYRG00021 [Hibiscus syriacus]|uniref:RNase H type-1 domain-containing protein n=1 Tax=Hibiscus syriacus TaxID=106335 RepID=A0A6A2X324_HIBSY|nr:hypothetical protein F3Y22_tig00112255pilonHSYRG00021 [Hibiscus syriacus]